MFILPDGVIQLEKLLRNLFLTLTKEISDTSLSLKGIQVSLISLARVITDEKTALDCLRGQGRACTIQIHPAAPGLMPWAEWKGQYRAFRRKPPGFLM